MRMIFEVDYQPGPGEDTNERCQAFGDLLLDQEGVTAVSGRGEHDEHEHQRECAASARKAAAKAAAVGTRQGDATARMFTRIADAHEQTANELRYG